MFASSAKGRPLLIAAIAGTFVLFGFFTLLTKKEYITWSSQSASHSSYASTPDPNAWLGCTSESNDKFRYKTKNGWTFVPERDERNLGLDEEQCRAAFPLQYYEIERAREWHAAQGGIDEDQIALWRTEPDKAHGQLRLLIYDGDLYVVGEKQGVVDRTRYLDGAAMIYRAITAVPDPRVLPNIEFTLDRMDHPNPQPVRPGRVAWGWTRHRSDNDTWVMPDFNGWASSSWDTVGGYRTFREKTKKYLTPFSEKTQKALWRGQINVGQKVSALRSQLIEAAANKTWSDVGQIRWEKGNAGVVAMEEHCSWQYLIHTEGNSWSGRLRNLVNCNSAIIIHTPLEYTAHFYSVLKAGGPSQNYIAAKSDWSDLDQIMNHYLEHPEEAARIGEETKKTLRDRYMTPAAEACYIRQMIHEWAKVQNYEPQLYKQRDGKETMRGRSWERFMFQSPPRFDIPPPPNDYFFKSDKVDFED
ncbi:EGF-domain serine glucosyl/xylosyltransferase [Microdochium nivale]|nr:EGF-domain serine glucosyl/xylosyltransferase [Microdochium nivale]